MQEMHRSHIGYTMDRSYACNALSLKSAAGGHGRRPSKPDDKSLTSIRQIILIFKKNPPVKPTNIRALA